MKLAKGSKQRFEFRNTRRILCNLAMGIWSCYCKMGIKRKLGVKIKTESYHNHYYPM
jgi:hypothetical protein